jgi:uncharacterized membrane protein
MNVLTALSPLDGIALAVWLATWLGYHRAAIVLGRRRPSIQSAALGFRRTWMREARLRDNRITDAALVGNLMQSATFFSSTTLLILGGLFALLGTIEKSTEVVQSLPFAMRTTGLQLELKALVLTLLFVYAFLRFTWSLRQFNLLNLLVGAFPPGAAGAADDPDVERAARLNELAGSNFTHGLRAYWWSVPLLLWLVNPWGLIVGAIAITAATWHMEFRSETVRALTGERER